jgi:hypothetical protein
MWFSVWTEIISFNGINHLFLYWSSVVFCLRYGLNPSIIFRRYSASRDSYLFNQHSASMRLRTCLNQLCNYIISRFVRRIHLTVNRRTFYTLLDLQPIVLRENRIPDTRFGARHFTVWTIKTTSKSTLTKVIVETMIINPAILVLRHTENL